MRRFALVIALAVMTGCTAIHRQAPRSGLPVPERGAATACMETCRHDEDTTWDAWSCMEECGGVETSRGRCPSAGSPAHDDLVADGDCQERHLMDPGETAVHVGVAAAVVFFGLGFLVLRSSAH